MNKILFLILILFPVSLFAGPYLVCDPQQGVTNYRIIGWSTENVIAQTDGSLRVDVGSATGTTQLTIKACKTDALWGERCSTTVPFVLSPPSPANAPQGTKLVP